jgi:hypothetical protein
MSDWLSQAQVGDECLLCFDDRFTHDANAFRDEDDFAAMCQYCFGREPYDTAAEQEDVLWKYPYAERVAPGVWRDGGMLKCINYSGNDLEPVHVEVATLRPDGLWVDKKMHLWRIEDAAWPEFVGEATEEVSDE